MPILHPNGRKLKVAKVVDLASLIKFVPPIYHDFCQKIVESHENVVASYKKKKTSGQKSKSTAKKSAVESEVEDCVESGDSQTTDVKKVANMPCLKIDLHGIRHYLCICVECLKRLKYLNYY